MKLKTRENGTRRTYSKKGALIAVVALAAVLFLAVVALTYVSINRQLYSESVSQLTEMSDQMFERLEAQIDNQWSHLKKVQTAVESKVSLTSSELCELLLHYEAELPPEGRTLKFRLIDSDGHYYTDSGRQGFWTGTSQLTDELDRQSFIITNWLDEEDYMAFVEKPTKAITVDGHAITRIVLLRPMPEMESYFKASAYDGNNIAFVVDKNGTLLFETGELNGIEHAGTNIFTYLKKQELPHLGYEDLLHSVESGNSICADVKIDGNAYFFVYDPFPQYDWGIVLLVSESSVATGAHDMIESVVRLFAFLMLTLIAVMALIAYLFIHIQKSTILLKASETKEKILAESNSQLTAAKREIENALEIANAATKAKSQFLANMSHDIRTPMNAILGIAKLIDHESDNPAKVRYYIAKLNGSGQYMLGLINDILDMSKIESGDVSMNLEPVKVAEQAGQIESIIRAQCAEKQQEFTVNVRNLTHEYLIGDSLRLRQIFLNLLTNAVKYTPNGGKISFAIEELPCDRPGFATIVTSVTDNGYGMSEEFQSRMFEAFSREVNSVTSKIQGTGLGLAITKSIVDLMGGKITVKSRPGEGSRFDVRLTLPIDANAPRLSGIERILLVFAEDALIANVRSALRCTNIEMRVAATSGEAAVLLDHFAADVILLSGYERSDTVGTIRQLRAIAPNALLFFCCDYDERDSVHDAMASVGVDGMISKPFFAENLRLAADQANRGTQTDKQPLSSLCGKRFLCAEDNELNAEILEALLDVQGASCAIYPNGAELVKVFANVSAEDFDAILMDVQMPVMNGLDAARAIRSGENPLGRSIPIIAMTANAFASDIRECLDAGMDAHISKPLDIKVLERIIKEASEMRGEKPTL